MATLWEHKTDAIKGPAEREIRCFDTRLSRYFELGHPSTRNDKVRVYVCGITPYDSSHLGHAFNAVSFDLLRRVLIYFGYRCSFAQNVTDVDDPLFAKARELDVDWTDLAASQVSAYRATMESLNVIAPESFLTVSEVIEDVVADAVALYRRSHGYQLDGATYFPVDAQHIAQNNGPMTPDDYVELFRERGGDPDRQGKRNALDSALWVRSEADEPCWDAPGLGSGRPGWHLECVTIAKRALGPLPVDIQGGGSDLAFPHHEMSRQEAEALVGAPLADYYMHVGMLHYQNAKMSKSLGNLIIVSDLVAAGWSPSVVRLALINSRYRDEVSWDPSMLDQASSRLRLWTQAAQCQTMAKFNTAEAQASACLQDDLDTPGAIRVIDAWCHEAIANSSDESGSISSEFINYVEHVLGILITSP